MPRCRRASQNGITIAIQERNGNVGRKIIHFSFSRARAGSSALASMQAASTAPKQPKIDARVAPLLKIGNLSFKDLNRNGVLDPYEDWRLPVEKRVADLLSRMTLEEKAGLMQITSFNAGSLEDYLNQRHIRYLILRDNLAARELAARANTSQELAEKSRLGIPIVFASNPRNHVRDNLVYEEAEAAGEFSSWPGTLGLAATNDYEAHSRVRRNRARGVARLGHPEVLRISGGRRDRAALVPYPDDVRREPEAERGDRPGDRAGLPGAGSRAGVGSAIDQALPGGRRRGQGPGSSQQLGAVGRLSHARQLLQVPVASVPGCRGRRDELDHELLQQPLEREERGTIPQGMVAVRQAAVRRSRRGLQYDDCSPSCFAGGWDSRDTSIPTPESSPTMLSGSRNSARRSDSPRRSRPAWLSFPTTTIRRGCSTRSTSTCWRNRT